MDLRVCFTLACLLGITLSAPVAQETARNFIPDRYDVRGELINDDGTFSRQEPQEEEPSFFDQYNKGQDNRLSYQQPNAYQSQYGQYGQQANNYNQEPTGQYNTGSQDQQTAFYNSPQENQETNDMPLPRENDDISKTDRHDYNQLTSQYYNQQQQTFNDQTQAEPQPQGYYGQQQQAEPQGYYGQQQQEAPVQQQFQYQPQPEVGDDMLGASRDQTRDKQDSADDLTKDDEESDTFKRDEILKQRIKKYQIPRNLSRKDLMGMQGFEKQIYLRGGH